MTGAFVTGITGQDGSYLAERLLADGVEVHGARRTPATGSPSTPLPDGVVAARRRPDRRRRAYAGCSLDVAPDEVYNLAGISSVAQSWEQPGLTAQRHGVGRRGAAGGGAAGCRSDRARRCGSCRPPARRSSATPTGRRRTSPRRSRPVNPYGAAKAYAHLAVGVYRGRGPARRRACILYNHESPRRPADVRHPQDHRGASPRSPAAEPTELTLGNLDARRDWGWAPDYVDAMVRGRARTTRAGDYVVATGVAHTRARLRRRGVRRAPASTTGRPLVAGRPGASSGRPTPPSWSATPRGPARVLGWAPTVDFEELVGRMVDADLEQVTR